MGELQESWPSGATWVFQGTIAEDATAGTHVCSLTITPGIGNEMELMCGHIVNGNTATAQIMAARIDDGANVIARFIQMSDTSALLDRSFPTNQTIATNVATVANGQNPGPMISGSMRLVLEVSTAAVSVTQTFGVACRLRGMAKPTAVLNDTIGTSTNTVNTNQVF